MGISKPGEIERLLKRVSGLLAKVIKTRDSYGRLRTETFRQVNVLLAGGMATVKKELEEIEDTSRVGKIIDLGERVQELAKEALKRSREG
jgi:hypothetical protein